MRSFAKWVLVVGMAALLAGPTMAQEQKGRRGQGKGGGGAGQRGGGFGGGGGFQFLLANASVQEELKVGDDQKTKIQEFSTKEREEMMARFQGGERPTPEQLAENQKKTNDARAKFAKETLKPDQLKRYNGIRLQQLGVMAFKEPEVQTSLKLTGDQKEKMNALAEDYTKDRNESSPMGRRGGGGGGGGKGGGGRGFGLDPETQQKLAKLSKDFMTKAEKVLTDGQQSEWKELVGKPFEVRFDFGGGRGR